MNVFHKVTLQSLKKNTTRTIVTIIGIILSAAMICAVTTFTSSFQNYALQTAIYANGRWEGREENTGFATYEKLSKAPQTDTTVYFQQLGYAVAEGCENQYKPYIYVLGAGEKAMALYPIHMLSGKLPQSPNEILLPEHLSTNGGIIHSIGDTLTLDLGQRMLEGYPMTQHNPAYTYQKGNEVLNDEHIAIREQRTYTVVGFYERLSYDLEPYDAPGYTAFTVADSPSDGFSYDIYYTMRNPRQIYDFIEENKLTGGWNTDVLLYQGSSRFSSFYGVLYGLAAIVIALIIFGSVSLIYNAFAISVSERTKQFGLLSSVGATRKQLRSMVLFEALCVSAVGIPLGVAAGIGGIGVTLMLIGDKFRAMGFPIDLELSVSLPSVAIAVVVALFTVLISAWIPSVRAMKVSAVEAIRQNQDISVHQRDVKTSKLTYRIFGLPGMLASKHYRRSRKKYRATVLSLFMSVVLFVSASAFTQYLTESVEGSFETSVYDLWLHLNAENLESISEEDLLNKIKNTQAVTDAAYVRSQYVDISVEEAYLTDEMLDAVEESLDNWNDSSKYAYLHTYVTFVNDEAFQAMLKKHGLDEKRFMDPNAPLAVAVDGSRTFNYTTQRYETLQVLQGETGEFVSRSIKELPGYWYSGEYEDENGKLYARYYEEDGDFTNPLDIPMEEASVTTVLRSGKTIYEPPFFLRAYDSIDLVYPMSLAKAVMGEYADANSGVQYLITSSDPEVSYTQLKSLLSGSGVATENLVNEAETEESQRNIVIIIQVFSYGFIVLISLIAAANVFNTISTNISLRRREFAMLKSVGMTAGAFNAMMNYECLLYGSRALLYGLPVSAAVTYLIWLAVSEGFETTFHLPYAAIGIAVFSVFAVVFVTMMYSMGKIKKDNPIDALKNENL